MSILFYLIFFSIRCISVKCANFIDLPIYNHLKTEEVEIYLNSKK